MSDLKLLLDRVRDAKGPDRELDLDLARALVPDVIVQRMRRWPPPDTMHDYTHWEYTGKVDDVIALVERVLPGRNVNLEIGNVGANRVTDAYISGADGYFEEPKTPDAHGYGLTPALALCAALLSALSAGERIGLDRSQRDATEQNPNQHGGGET